MALCPIERPLLPPGTLHRALVFSLVTVLSILNTFGYRWEKLTTQKCVGTNVGLYGGRRVGTSVESPDVVLVTALASLLWLGISRTVSGTDLLCGYSPLHPFLQP